MSALNENFLRIAKCGRANGLKGELALWPISNVEQRYVLGASFVDESGRSFEIENIRRNKDHYVVKFVGVSDRTGAEQLTNIELYAEPLDEDVLDDGEFFIHDCLNKTIVDQAGKMHGTIVNVIPNAASDLLETDAGDLVPFRFISRIDEESVHVDVPDGLFISEEKHE